MNKTFRVVVAPKKREPFRDAEGKVLHHYDRWTATTYVECPARKQAAGQALRKLQLLSSETRILRVEPA